MPTKVAESTADKLRRISEGARLRIDLARDHLDDLAEIRESAETIRDAELIDAADTILRALDALQLFIPGELCDALREALEGLQGVGALEGLDAFIDAHEEACDAVETMEGYRDDPSSGDAEEKSSAREAVREALSTLADAMTDAEIES